MRGGAQRVSEDMGCMCIKHLSLPWAEHFVC